MKIMKKKTESLTGPLKHLCLMWKTGKIPYLRVYKPHFSDTNLPSKIGVRLIHGILKNVAPPRKSRYTIDDWARDAGFVCCETPSRDC
jgi:hypothetical protein